MIFVTVGAQLPFDRMTRTVDAWAGRTGRDDVVAQIGATDFVPKHMRWTDSLTPEEYRRHMTDADAIIGHAGMGTIITAMQLRRPLLVMPRWADLHETRNDHQIATANRFCKTSGIEFADDENQLPEKLDQIAETGIPMSIGSIASMSLLATLRDFIHAGQPATAPLPAFDTEPAIAGVIRPTTTEDRERKAA